MSDETTNNTTTSEQANTTTETETANQNTDTVDWKAEADKWKAMSRKHETNWQTASKERDELKTATMTDAEKAIEAARAEGKTEALTEMQKRIGAAELKAAAGNAQVALPDSLISIMDTSSVINADGSANTDLINQILSGLTPAKPGFSQNVGVGPQSSTGVAGQITRDDLSRMTPAEIVKARQEGKLNHFFNGG